MLGEYKTNSIISSITSLALVYNPPPLFDLKLEYSYVIKVADFESDLGLFSTALVSE